MISDRDLLALSIIGAENAGVDTSRAKVALDRLDDKIDANARAWGVAVYMVGWNQRPEENPDARPSWTALTRREAEDVIRLNIQEGRVPTALMRRNGDRWVIEKEYSS